MRPARLGDVELLAGGAEPLGQAAGAVARRFRAQHDELLAADAGEQLLGPQQALEAVRERTQHGVAADVAVGVVDALEVIDVEQHQRQRTGVAAGALELAVELFLEAAAVEDVGQAVADDEVVDRLVIGVLGVLLVQELEDDGADLEAIAAREQLVLAHRLVVQEGAVAAAEILEPDLAVVEDEARVAPRDRRDVRKAERDLARAADLERALGRDADSAAPASTGSGAR